MKILTFVIPAYNSEPFLDKGLGSMLHPEILEKLEIIVVNDGSKDTTPVIAQGYCDRYPDVVRLINQENKGHGGALNAGCAAARGKYLKVIDADDWVITENLPAFIEKLENCNSDVVLTHYHTVDISNGQVKNWMSYPNQFDTDYTFDDIMADWKSFDRSLALHGLTYRTDFYHRMGIQLSEHVFYEDNEFATFPCAYAASLRPLDLFIYEYRVGDVNQSVSYTNQLKRLSHTETVIRRMEAEYSKMPEIAGKRYAAAKTHGVVLSYLTTVLLTNPDKAEGRKMAREAMEQGLKDYPEIYGPVKKKYQVFAAMNRLHLGRDVWERILASRLYNRLRGNHDFE